MVRRFVVLLVMATLAASCGLGQSSDPPASLKSRVKVSYILGYENLTDQILDADLVVLGTAADVETVGVNRYDDGSGVTDRTMGITVHIDEVLRSSGVVEATAGTEIRISTIQPYDMAIHEVRGRILLDNPGVWFLLDSNSLRRRLGQDLGEESVLVFQNGSALALRDDADSVEYILPLRRFSGTFEAYLETVQTAAGKVADMPQPERPLGLPDGWGEGK